MHNCYTGTAKHNMVKEVPMNEMCHRKRYLVLWHLAYIGITFIRKCRRKRYLFLWHLAYMGITSIRKCHIKRTSRSVTHFVHRHFLYKETLDNKPSEVLLATSVAISVLILENPDVPASRYQKYSFSLFLHYLLGQW